MRTRVGFGLTAAITVFVALAALQVTVSAKKKQPIHTCVHHQIIKGYKPHKPKISAATKARKLANANLQWRPIQYMFDYSALITLDPVKAAFLMNDLMPAVAKFLASFIKVNVDPTVKWAAPVKTCYQATVPAAYRQPVLTGDVLIFVTYLNENATYLAWATTCSLDPTNNRPRMGQVNFRLPSLDDIGPDNFNNLFLTIVHELNHALGVSASLFDSYVDENGVELGATNVVQATTIRGANTTIIVLPSVVEYVREYFNCPTCQGAELENQGPVGTIGSHWERRNHMNELLSPSLLKYAAYTNLTLTLLASTGWYQIDKSIAQSVSWAKGAGCDFLTQDCFNSNGIPVYNGFCYGLNNHENCTYEHTRKALCSWVKATAATAVSGPFDYIQGEVTNDPFADNCLYPSEYSNGDCEDPSNAVPSQAWLWEETFAPGSRCFEGTYIKKTARVSSGSIPNHSGCQKYQCLLNSAGQWYVQIQFTGTTPVNCDPEGGQTNITGYNGYILCPSAKIFCADEMANGCAASGYCNGFKMCYNNTCICPPGYEAPNCTAWSVDCTQSNACNGQGTCSNSTCTCEPGWFGKQCNQEGIQINSSSCSSGISYGSGCLPDLNASFDQNSKLIVQG